MGVDSASIGNDSLLLVQFARSPRAGVKSRMMPYLSASQACDLHCELTLWTARQLLASGLGEVELSVAGDTQHAVFRHCQSLGVARVSRQQGADLGHRMYHAIRSGLRDHSCVLLVGSDCPAIDPAYLQQAAAALQETPVVLGPATDGGYVLIGARSVSEKVFQDIPWGGDQVCARTRNALERSGLAWTELPTLADIDRPEDLPIWERIKQDARTAAVPA